MGRPFGRVGAGVRDRERGVRRDVSQELEIVWAEGSLCIAPRQVHDADDPTARHERRDGHARDVQALDERPPFGIEVGEQACRVDDGNDDRLTGRRDLSLEALTDALAGVRGRAPGGGHEIGIGVMNGVGLFEEELVGAEEANRAEVTEQLAHAPGHQRQEGGVIIARGRKFPRQVQEQVQPIQFAHETSPHYPPAP